MNLPSKTIFSKKVSPRLLIYLFFIVIHFFLFNINVAEWGDSYRILKASEYIKEGTYPGNEKRPPLFSAVLSVNPDFIDAITWGRAVVFVSSFVSFILFDKLTQVYIKKEKYRLLSLVFFILNPIYLYWSTRIMTDVMFSLLVLLAFYLLATWKSLNFRKVVILGVVCGLAILTRFEGYLLLTAILISVAFQGKEISSDFLKPKFVFDTFLRIWKKPVLLGLTTLVVILPWLLYRGLFESTYFDEPFNRTYDFKMVWTYFSSILYLPGFTFAFYFIFKKFKIVSDFLKKNIGITVFLCLSLILILLWPAAIPRLFVPLIPFFVLIFILSFSEFWENGDNLGKSGIVITSFLLVFYIFSQYFLRLQFLVVSITLFSILILIQLLIIFLLFKKRMVWVIAVTILSMFTWSLGIIYSHKNIYSSVKYAAEFAVNNFEGVVAYNGAESVFDWYLNHSNMNEKVHGTYYEVSDKGDLEFDRLLKKDMDYLIVTNEDDPTMHFDLQKRAHLVLVQEFRYNVKDKIFFTKIFKFDKE